jgi:arsenate reductase-like glutaredoxin family protein
MRMNNKDLAYKAVDYIITKLTERTLVEHMPEIWDELEEIIEEVRRKIMETKY